MQERIMADDRTYTVMGGARLGRTWAMAFVLKMFPHKKCLMPDLKSLDAFISLGVKPSQLVLPTELPMERSDQWVDISGKSGSRYHYGISQRD